MLPMEWQKTAEPIEMLFGMFCRVDLRIYKESCIILGPDQLWLW